MITKEGVIRLLYFFKFHNIKTKKIVTLLAMITTLAISLDRF
jgi:hypothetical protein